MTNEEMSIDIRIEKVEFQGRKQTVLAFSDQISPISGYIVIDSLALGPAAGGCRMAYYPDKQSALTDAQRLARGMSQKNALAELPLGGGKSVIMLPKSKFDRERVFRLFGHALNQLGGNYHAAEDVGTGVNDMQIISTVSPHVFGLPRQKGKAGGDPSPRTADGVFRCIRELLEYRGIELEDAHVAVQGLGSVGLMLCKMLLDQGVRLTVADVLNSAVKEIAFHPMVTTVGPQEILAIKADLLAPCALGAILNEQTIPELKVGIIAGAANNQLECLGDAERLMARGILYAPDYIVNAGGIINVASECFGEPEYKVTERIQRIPSRLMNLVKKAQAQNCSVAKVADDLANAIIASQDADL